MADKVILAAVSNTTAVLVEIDSNGNPQLVWRESSHQPLGNAIWLKNGKAFLTTQGGNVMVRVFDGPNQKEKPPVVLSVPPGPLLGRMSADGKCLALVQSSMPGILSMYDMHNLLVSVNSQAKPPVVLQDHDRPILAMAASPCSTHIATSNSIGTVYIHDAGNGARATLGALPGGPTLTPKRCLAFSQLYKPLRLAAGADDGQVLVWQISPMASGPVVMPNKLRGRVMGVGFAAYNKLPASVLVACSESGHLCLTDMRNYPNVQCALTVELSVSISCMSIRDDGQLLAVGSKDGRIGLLRVDELIAHRQITPGMIKVISMDTHLDVIDIAFQRLKDPRDQAREGQRASLAAATPGGAAPEPSATHQAPPADAVDGRRGSGWVAELLEGLVEEPPLKKHAAHSVLMAAGSGSQRQGLPDKQDAQAARIATAASAGAVAGGALQRQQSATLTASTSALAVNSASTRPASALQPAVSGGVPAAAAATPSASGGVPATGVSGQPSVLQPSGSSGQLQPARHPSVPPVVIPGVAPPVAQYRRPSDMGGGGGNASSSTTPTGAQGAGEDTAGADGQAASPVARAAAGAGASSSSPVSSPLRPRSPRATVSGGGYPPARPYGSTGGDLMVPAAFRSYLDDFRQEMRDLVRGLQADMVRQAVVAEMMHRNDVATLQQENRVLQDEIKQLRQQLDANLRFGLLGQQGAPWQ